MSHMHYLNYESERVNRTTIIPLINVASKNETLQTTRGHGLCRLNLTRKLLSRCLTK